MPKPSFFVVGAPRCGTTALCHYLDQHPSIFVSKPKEPNFFDGDLLGLKPLHRSYTLDEYLHLFDPGTGKLCGEGTVWYMLSKIAARDICQFNPEAKIIIMLRHPVDFLRSLHRHLVFYQYEDIVDFNAALEAEADRRQGKRLPPNSSPTELLRYSELARFSEQVQRYLHWFDRRQIHVIRYEDFAKDTTQIYHRVLQFLGVDPTFKTTFKVMNAGRQPTVAIAPSVIQRLQAQYAPDLLKLSQILDCHLSYG